MFRAGPQAPDIGPALLTMLRTVAGLRDRAPWPWTVRGPSHRCKQCNQGHRRHGSVVSVQVVRTMHEAVLLIIRRSWVRTPPAPPELDRVNVRNIQIDKRRLHHANTIDNVREPMDASIVTALRMSSRPSVCAMPSPLASGPAAAEVPNRHRLGSDVVHHPVAADAQPPSVR